MSGDRVSDQASTGGATKHAVHILGAGCAGLSLAARAGDLPAHDISIYDPRFSTQADAAAAGDDAPDHIWGFWRGPGMDGPAELARHSWHNWRIITPHSSHDMHSTARPYMAVNRSIWLAECANRARKAGVRFLHSPLDDTALDDKPQDDKLLDNASSLQIIDSRTPKMPKSVMIQHFIGWEISAASPCFNPDTAILMDFRCDQSRGLHFVYLLPFSATEALVESTMFSTDLQEDAFYETAICENLAAYYACDKFTVTRIEAGAIPMAEIAPHDSSLAAIGANGGAIRPSSGYAFAFIQQQIAAGIARDQQLQNSAENPDRRARALRFTSPHHLIDILMDRVFLRVLRKSPAIAPTLFARMAAALNGDEFAAFMSGQAGWGLRLKMIMAMPKWPFIRALLPALMMGGRDG